MNQVYSTPSSVILINPSAPILNLNVDYDLHFGELIILNYRI
jgi:hypothetical protein